MSKDHPPGVNTPTISTHPLVAGVLFLLAIPFSGGTAFVGHRSFPSVLTTLFLCAVLATGIMACAFSFIRKRTATQWGQVFTAATGLSAAISFIFPLTFGPYAEKNLIFLSFNPSAALSVLLLDPSFAGCAVAFVLGCSALWNLRSRTGGVPSDTGAEQQPSRESL